ncbi:DsbA family oxidoreductase [Erythrobacter alti]|uniref:DsbA family oxidoreductase n=1 Tax=Erythrobacter alti TaxID=1896145 RepID=UPI0030F3D811
MTEIDVEIWSDVMCPWCAVGYAQFTKAMEMVADEVAVTFRWMPFELDPDAPAEGGNALEHLAEKYGYTLEEAAAKRDQMEAAAEEAGFPLTYDGEGNAPDAMRWNTFNAHKLLRWALATKGPEVQTALKLAFFKAHFRERRNISDPQVLAEIAGEVPGLRSDDASEALGDDTLATATRLETERGREMGITAVPSFVIANKYLLQGAQGAENFAKALRNIANMEPAESA